MQIVGSCDLAVFADLAIFLRIQILERFELSDIGQEDCNIKVCLL